MNRVTEFFLNDADKTDAATPAFSITKILTVFAPVATAVVAALVASIENVTFTESQLTLLLVALVILLAVLGASDVLARGRVEAAKHSRASAREVSQQQAEAAVKVAEGEAATAKAMSEATSARPRSWVPLTPAISASLGKNGSNNGIDIVNVKVVAASDGRFLCVSETGAQVSWEPANHVTFKN